MCVPAVGKRENQRHFSLNHKACFCLDQMEKKINSLFFLMGSVHNSGDLFVYLSICCLLKIGCDCELYGLRTVLMYCCTIYLTNFNALHGVTYLLLNSSSTNVECI